MFEPKYNITPKLLANIKRIGIIVADLNKRHFDQVSLVKFEKNAKELSAYSSTSIEGNPLPLTEVKEILKNKPEYIRDSEREVLNYNKMLEILVDGLKRKRVNFSLELILEIQKIVTDGLIDCFNSGAIRKEPVFVNDPISRKPIYLPPDHQDVPTLVQDLIDFIASGKTKLDPLILAGIFHKQFVLIHPFTDGNGRTARLVTKVLLANMGLDIFSLFSFENYYNQNVTRYFERVGERGNYYEIIEQIDFTNWLEYFTDGIVDELLRVRKLLEISVVSPDTTLKPYHLNIIEFIKNHGFIADRDYAELTERAKPTRNKDFNKLIALGFIERFGKGKATYYKLRV